MIRHETEKPLCSVVMATRNKAAELAVTLESIAVQAVPFLFEVIVVDDGSTDSTHEVCQRYGVQYHRLENPKYRNSSVARNVGYRAARGDIILAQSDEVVHVTPHAIEFLTRNLHTGEFLLAQVDNYRYENGKPVQPMQQFCGPDRQVPLFFLDAVWRRDLYAVGGNDEEFVRPAYEDDWFADCLMHGLGLRARYTGQVVAHHQSHAHAAGRVVGMDASERLLTVKREWAERTGWFCSSGGPWQMGDDDATEGKIPKHASFFWAGPRMSWMRYLTLHTFRQHNPDWRITLYQPAEAARGKAVSKRQASQDSESGPDYTARLGSLDIEVRPWTAPLPDLGPAHAADFCEWDQLGSGGGFFSDMDILFLRPMPHSLVRDANAVFCGSGGLMSIGFLGASPGCRLFQDISQAARTNCHTDGYESAGANAIYAMAKVRPRPERAPGPECLKRFRVEYPDLFITSLHPETIYPFEYTQVDRIFSEANEVPAQCCGIHWFGGSAISQEWNRLLTHENYRDYRNTFTANVPS